MSILKTKNLQFFIIIISLLLINSQPYKSERPPMGKDKDEEPPDLKNNKNLKNNNLNIITDLSDLKKKHEIILKENINSKAKLKKYNLYCSIIEFFNIILALILSFFLIIRLYTYYKSKRNENDQINNNIISVVEINNNNIDIIKRNLNEISISKQSFEIKGENDIIDKGEAPPLTFNS